MNSPIHTPRNPRYATLDIWRGIACLMIVVLHSTHNAVEPTDAMGRAAAGVLVRLGIGVPMFFVISGYCISATCDTARHKPRAPARFFSKRFRRIFPPYWIIALASLTLAFVLAAVGDGYLVSGEYGYIPHPMVLTPAQWFGNITLTETWRWHFFGDGELKIVGPAWTLCYEEQFYAVCGLLLFLAPRYFFTGIAIITILTLIVAPVALARPALLPIQGLFFDGRWLMFAEGVGVYYAINYLRSRTLAVCFFVFCLATVAALRWGLPSVRSDEVARLRCWEIVGSTVFTIVLLMLHLWDRKTAGLRLLRPVAICGQMCYSLYLVHWPIAVVMTTAFYAAGIRGYWPTLLLVAPITIAASLTAGWAFHLAVERRFLNTVAPAANTAKPAIFPLA